MISISQLEEGQEFDFGTCSLSEDEIISFGKQFDPLPFHINKEAAKKSHFKELVASGPHLFTKVHRDSWIPIFGHTVLAGLEINNWRFLKPIYANMDVYSRIVIVSIKLNHEKQHAIVVWQYLFTNSNREEVQRVNATVLHQLD